MWATTIPRILPLLAGFQHLAFAQSSTLLSTLSSECISFISAYPPTISLYASQVCHVCQGLQLSPSIEPCCANANQAACFASSFFHTSVSGATMPAPTLPPTSGTPTGLGYFGSTNCESVTSIIEVCQASTPGFNNLCFHDMQSCLCSTSGTWAPSFYDNYWSSCLEWASTADPPEYSALGPDANGVVQSRVCQTWGELTATGGTPSDCLTSPLATLSSVSLFTGSPTSVGHKGAAVQAVDGLVRLRLLLFTHS
jgi:hypothetical protein